MLIVQGTRTRMIVATSSLILSFSLAACGSYRPDPYLNRIRGDVALTSTADVSHTILIDTKDGRKVCIQPPADAAFKADRSESADFSLFAFGGKDQGKIGAKSDTGETQFDGRNPSVLITREVLYRLCEMSINQGLTKEETLDSFNKALSSLSESWSADSE